MTTNTNTPHGNIKVLFVDGQTKSEHDPLLVPASASPSDLYAVVSTLHSTDTTMCEYELYLDDTTPLSNTPLADSLLAISGRRPGEQVVRLYYYPRQPFAMNSEQVYPDWIRSIKCVDEGRVAVGVYDKTVRFGTTSDSTIMSVNKVVNAFVQCEDGNLIGGCSDGTLLNIPSLSSSTSLSVIGSCSSAVMCLLQGPNGSIVAGGHDGTISVHDPNNRIQQDVGQTGGGTKKGRKKPLVTAYKPVQSSSVHQDCVSTILPSPVNNNTTINTIVSVGLDRRVCHVDVDRLTTTHCAVTPSAITCADLSSSLSSYILGHADGSIRLYSPATDNSHTITTLYRCSSWISSIAVNPDKPHLFAVGDHAGRVRVCDVRHTNSNGGGVVWETGGGGGKVLAVAFSPDGHRLYSGGEECVLREYTL